MNDGENPHIFSGHLENDTIVTDSQLPVAAQRPAERCPEACRFGSETRLENSGETPAGLTRNFWKIVGPHRRVIAECVRQLAFLDATPLPNLVVGERSRPDQRSFTLFRNLCKRKIFIRFKRIAEEVACLCRQ